MKIAAAAYPIDFHEDWASYADKQRRWIEEAQENGAELLVFPEYGGMEICSIGGEQALASEENALLFSASIAEEAAAIHEELAREYGVYMLAGSSPAQGNGPRPVNGAGFFGPEGRIGVQDKQILTRWERDEADMRPGGPLNLFDIGEATIGVTICYDSEFPLFGRKLAETGANLLLCPSSTETEAGYYRVRIGAQARALENQCVAVHAPHIGKAAWCPCVDSGFGAAAVYGPPDRGFPSNGIIAQGEINEPGWVYADFDPAAVDLVREDGRVLNFQHWPEQHARPDPVMNPGAMAKNT